MVEASIDSSDEDIFQNYAGKNGIKPYRFEPKRRRLNVDQHGNVKMYGLIMMNMSEYVIEKWGVNTWETLCKTAGIPKFTFSTHQMYPDNWIPDAGSKVQEVLNVSEKEFFSGMGKFFVHFLSPCGYDVVLKVLGRHLRDFINNLDNLHEYLRFSYQNLQPASFFCENETEKGLTLHYRSKRRGFVWYVVGQIKEVGKHFYDIDIDVDVLTQEIQNDTLHVKFQLNFNNTAFEGRSLKSKNLVLKPVTASVLIKMFPFCIVFGNDLVINSLGSSLNRLVPSAIGKRINNAFDLKRPLILLTWTNIMAYSNNVFELMTKEPITDKKDLSTEKEDGEIPYERPNALSTRMEKFLLSCDANVNMHNICFKRIQSNYQVTAAGALEKLANLVNAGLYLNDLSLHDFSRDRVLSNQEQSSELKLAFETELEKSKELETMMTQVDLELQKTDQLLYQMIPKAVADRLRQGAGSVETCQYFDATTILFSDVVGFAEISCKISPMQIVALLNGMYSLFDKLSEVHQVYKVETIGDSYMVVCGAPEKNSMHAIKICEMGLDMVNVIGQLEDPSTGDKLQIRVGIHSGAVVAGVVGLKAPRYCLFGDTVNTASRMESNSEALKIHISEYTRMYLKEEWEVKLRGNVQVKGKGAMNTYWLIGKVGGQRAPSRTSCCDDRPSEKRNRQCPWLKQSCWSG
ncbi:Soluble guanylate cyclase 88E [Nymphon striatum]|nr:Soluble guanylate cyclase 88E [Nymphon striatum]